ncbi:hypothetical protein Goklo_009389 [Gossypium klotzschianum]|uniref:D-isomer specific 2-hydroxyacid dehydrogenase NAD-binding domain-containing protein n=1 Tax=Gossypium klotzschianum TaxID=34286 RepID=A0A7J8V3N3_9ROSI|nr:hypothetical protein [Gossypium klotzschianum]
MERGLGSWGLGELVPKLHKGWYHLVAALLTAREGRRQPFHTFTILPSGRKPGRSIGRGGLIDEKELVKFLVKGRVGGADLDVHEDEPHTYPNKLAKNMNRKNWVFRELEGFSFRALELQMATVKEEALPLVLVHRPPNFHFPFKHHLQTHFRLLDPLDSDPPESTHSFFSCHAASVRVLLCVDTIPITRDLLSLVPFLQHIPIKRICMTSYEWN